ncbi:unnamed protein product, partial [Closterium sp. Naga37s-1]
AAAGSSGSRPLPYPPARPSPSHSAAANHRSRLGTWIPSLLFFPPLSPRLVHAGGVRRCGCAVQPLNPSPTPRPSLPRPHPCPPPSCLHVCTLPSFRQAGYVDVDAQYNRSSHAMPAPHPPYPHGEGPAGERGGGGGSGGSSPHHPSYRGGGGGGGGGGDYRGHYSHSQR